MTEISSSTPLPLNGHAADVPLSVPVPTSLATSDAPLLKAETNPDEDFTIKCVCGYKDDDGNTVYCDKCDSWQHIECYYPREDVPEVHNCTDCLPRYINSTEATERQRHIREEQEREKENDRKARRSAAGKAKKKRPNGLELSETPERRTKSPKDTTTTSTTAIPTSTTNSTPINPQPKRPKASHKSSASTGRATSATRTRRSPSKSLQSSVPWSQKPTHEQFSPDFIRSFGRPYSDIGNGHNTFTNLAATRDVSSWIHEPRPQGLDVLRTLWNKSSAWYNSLSLPSTSVAEIADTSKEAHGGHPRWHVLRMSEPVAHDHMVGELKGHIGRWEDYANDSKNKWYRRFHPEPFVFGLSRFPVYVDSRQDGSLIRFVRRSCRPTAALRTIVVDNVQAHFLLEATVDLKQGAELTLPWEFAASWTKLMLSVKSDEVVTASDYDQAQPLIDGLLADYGGCACDKSVPCAFDRFYQRELLKKKHRPKPSKTIEDDEDNRSTSGSVKSKPQSRDLTPMTHVSEVPDMSDRERRKLMAQLSLFDQAEVPQKKKKQPRTSGPQAVCNLSKSKRLTKQKTPDSATDSPDGFKFPAVSKKTSSSPIYPANYVHCEIQTDPEDEAWYAPPQRTPQREFVPIAVRLLRQCHQRKMQFEEQKKRKAEETIEMPAKRQATDPPAEIMDTSPDFASPTMSVKSLSVKSSASPVLERTESAMVSPIRTDVGPQITAAVPQTNGHRGSDLRVTLPPTPAFSSLSQPPTPVLTTPNGPQTPYPVTPSLISPSLTSTYAAPSPIKKKLSLSDYAKRRAALPTGASGSVLNSSTNKQSSEELPPATKASEDIVMKDSASVSSPTLSVDMLPPPPLPPSSAQAAPST